MSSVLIYGDSQAGIAGLALQKVLQGQGHTVKRVSKAGYGVAKLLATAKSLNLAATPWDHVYLFAGGNDKVANLPALRQLIDYFKPAPVTYVVLPPATLITNLTLAAKMWGKPKITPAHFFPETAARREKVAAAYIDAALQTDTAIVFDVRDPLWPDAVKQPSGVVFPSQPDGIHIGPEMSKAVAPILAGKVGDTGVPVGLLIGVAAGVVAAFLLWRRGKG